MAEEYQLLPDLSEEEYAELKADIARRGVQVPVEKDEQGNVLDGFHRVRACEELGVRDYPVIIRAGMTHEEKVDHALRANLNRRHLSREQLQDLAVTLRQRGWTQERIASVLCVPRPTITRWLADVVHSNNVGLPTIIVDALGRQQPATKERKPSVIARNEREAQRVIEALAVADAEKLPNGLIDVQQVIRSQRGHGRVVTPPLPKGKYAVIYADPPWRYDFSQSENRQIENHYSTLTTEEICALPVSDVATNDCVLFLWSPNPKLEEALQVIKAWGFTYKTNMVWVKDKIGMGYYARQKHELLLIATKGNPMLPTPADRLPSVICAPRTEHSRKPIEFYEAIERMYPDFRRVELFARSRRAGWEAWGNEVNGA